MYNRYVSQLNGKTRFSVTREESIGAKSPDTVRETNDLLHPALHQSCLLMHIKEFV